MTPALTQKRSASLEAARTAVRLGRLAEAEAAYLQLVEDPAAALEALDFLGSRAFQRADISQAGLLLERAINLAPNHPDTLCSLGVVYETQGRLDEALCVFERAAKIDPKNFIIRLRLGKLLDRRGRAREALPNYFASIVFANEKGKWTSIETTSPGILADVQRARDVVRAGRHALFHEAIAPVRSCYGPESVRRIEKALAIYLQEASADIPDRRQRPQFMFVPDLPSQTYFSHHQVPFFDQLEAAFPAIRDEAQEIASAGALPSFFTTDDPEFLATKIKGDHRAPSWDAFFFYRFGRRLEQNHARAPKTSSVIEALPLARISNHAPEICFSLLTPGTVIQPHQGVSNCRIVVHLPLIVPENCAISVGGEIRHWQEGHCMAFDDTFEHEAWNKSEDQIRIVMLMDTWNPNLTEAERMALTDLIVGIGDFNAEVLGSP